jgi:hypothetical protein
MLFFLCLPVADATTYVVDPAGTGDFPTIQAAIDVVVDGDMIELTDGIFTGSGNRDLSYLGKAITIRSQSGDPATCHIDCENAGRAFVFVNDEGPGSVLESISMINGRAAVYPEHVGGAINCSGGDPLIHNCGFYNNYADEGGAVNLTSGCRAMLSRCQFVENSATVGGAVTVASGSLPTIEGCTFACNTATMHFGGGLSLVWSIVTVRDCTFGWNAAPAGGGIYSGYGGSLEMHNSIVAFSTMGAGVECGGVDPTLTCCDIYGNDNGDWVGCVANQYGINGNICADPLFCNPGDLNFRLEEESPCAPFSEPNPECDLLGAWPVGCYPEVVEDHPTVAAALLTGATPNPFALSTRIEYAVLTGAADLPTSLGMYDAGGRLVRTLLTGVSPAGRHVVTWDGTDQSGVRVARGIYLCRLTVGEASSTERVIFMR